MTRQEAREIESICEGFFKELGYAPAISMALIGRLRIDVGDNYFNFDLETGDVIYVRYEGHLDDLQEKIDKIKQIVTKPENKVLLRVLKWSYDNYSKLTD